MRDYQEISNQIRGYYKLKKELEDLSVEALKNFGKEKYSYFLNIEHSLKNQIFDGEELLKITEDIYSEYSSKNAYIEEKNGELEKENSELKNALEKNSKLENILKVIVGITKNGTIIEQIQNVLKKYKE